jgi:glycine cleavage system H protein
MSDKKYTKSHEWASLESNGEVVVGISKHAAETLGDMVFVELPEIGKKIIASKECGVVESVKSASDLYSPISGEVIAVNNAVVATPAMLNQDPEGAAWLFKVRPANVKEMDSLMNTVAYDKFLAEEAH